QPHDQPIPAHGRGWIGLRSFDRFFRRRRRLALRAARQQPDSEPAHQPAERARTRHAGLMPGRLPGSKVEHLVRFRPEVYLAGVPALLEVRGLETQFATDEGVVRAVDRVSFSIEAGKTLGMVGESGCGKSVTALSILRLVPSPPGRIVGGEILYQGRNLLALSESE